MDAGSNAPIIIKRKKVIAGGGHHGGAWKVAYADFVTAMMAFFLLMWLLSSTSEQQKAGLADYFTPTIPFNRVSGGGDGVFGGDSVMSTDTVTDTGTGGVSEAEGEALAEALETEALREIEEALLGLGGETMLSDNALRHIVTRLTDEGLVIEIFDRENAGLFDGDTSEPMPVTQEIAAVLSRLMDAVRNDLALSGHVRAQSFLRIDYPVWTLSTSRADVFRRLLEDTGTTPERVVRLTGKADREPVVTDPQAVRNNRIELIVLRSDQ